MSKIKNKVITLKKTATLPNGSQFPAGQEFEIVQGVVYMNGHPVIQNAQSTLLNWIEGNPRLFKEEKKW